MMAHGVAPGTERRLWAGIVTGPLAWTLAELVGYAAVGRGCGAEGVLGPWQWLASVGLASAAALATGLAGYGAYRVFAARADDRLPRAEAPGRIEFMGMVGVLVSAFLALNMVLFAIVPILVDPCERMR